MKHSALKVIICLAACIIASRTDAASAERKCIQIRTASTQMILSTDSEGHLLFNHYGKPVSGFETIVHEKAKRRSNYGTRPLAYPTAGWRNFDEPALSITYESGEQNTDLLYDSHRHSTPKDGVRQTVITLKDPKTALQVDLVYTAYEKEDVIKCSSVIRNCGKTPLLMKSYYSSALPLEANTYTLGHFYGSAKYEMNFVTEPLTRGIKSIESKVCVRATHQENPSFILGLDSREISETAGNVVAGALCWSGNYKLNFQVDAFNVLTVTSGINPYESTYPLAPGQSFETPDMVYTFSSCGAGQASRNLHDWARADGLYNGRTFVPTLLNNWEGTFFDFNEEKIKEIIDGAAALGVEMFVLDDGWFGGKKFPRDNDRQGLGDWDIVPSKLPHGIDHLAKYAHSKGLKFGIWIEPEMVNPKSLLAQKHPDWIVGEKGRENPQMRNQWILDLSNPAVQDFVFGVFDNTMRLSKDIDYIKWDANRHVENMGSAYLGKDQGKFFVDYTKGYYNVMKRIRAKYPDVMIQTCASGGGRIDYGAFGYTNEAWGSDNTDPASRIFIQWGETMIYPAMCIGSHVSVSPNKQTTNETSIKFRFDVASSCRLGVELQPSQMTPGQREFCSEAIANYKTYRDIIFDGDLYRLNSPYDEDGLCALSYVSKDKKRALLYIFKLHYTGDCINLPIRMQGLPADTMYRITELNPLPARDNWFTKKTPDGKAVLLSGSFLTERGVVAEQRPVFSSSVFLLEAE